VTNTGVFDTSTSTISAGSFGPVNSLTINNVPVPTTSVVLIYADGDLAGPPATTVTFRVLRDGAIDTGWRATFTLPADGGHWNLLAAQSFQNAGTHNFEIQAMANSGGVTTTNPHLTISLLK